MGLRILKAETGEQVLYCSTTMVAFGVVHEDEDFDLEDFIESLPKDARTYEQKELADLYYKWLKEKQDEKAFDQWDGGYEGDGKFADNQ